MRQERASGPSDTIRVMDRYRLKSRRSEAHVLTGAYHIQGPKHDIRVGRKQGFAHPSGRMSGRWLIILGLWFGLLAAYPTTPAEAHTPKPRTACKHHWQGEYKTARRRFTRCIRQLQRHNKQHRCGPHARPRVAIRCAFPRHHAAAIRVARCESSLRTTARNGQYHGLFQMGAWERERYGHSTTPLGQARAARRYFDATGRTWTPWECKP